MRILITGASGYLGQLVLRKRDLLPAHELVLASRQPDPENLPAGVRWQTLSGNVSRDRACLESCKATHLFHFAAASSPAYCEQAEQESRTVNVDYTRMLAEVARHTGAHLLFTSTDWVFDGNTYDDPFTENDVPQAKSVYAKQKHAVEHILATEYQDVSFLVLRLSLVFGAPFSAGGTAAWMNDRFKQGPDVPLFHDEYRTPIYSDDLVSVFAAYVRKPFSGLYHCGGSQRLSRVEMGRLFAESFGYDPGMIVSKSRASAGTSPERPQDLSLCSSALEEVTGIRLSRYDHYLEFLKRDLAS